MNFIERLNQVHDRLLSPEFLTNAGIGNEIGFYIFDYPPDQELLMRQWLRELPQNLLRRRPDLKFAMQDLFSLLVDYLKSRKLYDKAVAVQKQKGNDSLLAALHGPLDAGRILDYFVKAVRPAEHDFVILHGIGKAWPLIRSHSLLNNLQAVMGRIPLVMFYPGVYDMQGLSLFGRLPSDNYYRAFRLVS